jgi:DNA sulfur modification protein DndE
MFSQIKTSKSNKILVTELTHKLNLGAENVIARIAFSYSLAKSEKLNISTLKDSQGKEYSKNVLFGNMDPYYIGLICTKYVIYKTDKDIPKYIKLHLDDGLELIAQEVKNNPNRSGFDYIIEKIDIGLKEILEPSL